MGSFIARDYAAKYGDELSGLIICGTAGGFPGVDESEAELQQAVDSGKGGDSDPAYGTNLLGWMCERCGDIKYGNEWICSDPYVQKDHAEDPFDAFTKPVKNLSLLYFVQMIKVIGGEDWAKKVPTALPIYNIAGGEDPVGLYGKGVCEVSNWLVGTGHNVTTKLYSGYRHEIHNYADLKSEVEAGIIDFVNKQLS
jgi:alpha-beta hydrolase superfamily lysophospholipase